GDFLVLEFPRGRHFHRLAVSDDFEQTAAFRIARDHDGPALPAMREPLRRSEVESGSFYFGVVTGLATVDQNGSDFLFKEFGSRCLGPNGSPQRTQQNQ